MAFRDLYPFLPGHLVDLKDGGLAALKPEPDAPVTESVLLLGTATDGPVRVPVAISPETASIFGKVKDSEEIPNGATLLKGFEELWKGGCRDVRLMRISGTKAGLEVPASQLVTETPTSTNEVLGQTAGNDQVTFSFNETCANVISIKAGSNELTVTEDYTVDLVANSFTIKAGACAPGQLITAQYEDDLGVIIAENATNNLDGTVADWIASGSDQILSFSSAPIAGTLTVTAGGSVVDPVNYTVNGTDFLLSADAGLEPELDISAVYSYNKIETQTPKIFLESDWGGELYNQAKSAVENIKDDRGAIIGKKLIIKFPPSKVVRNITQLEYSSIKYLTLSQMVQAILEDLNKAKGIVKARCNKSMENIESSTLQVMPETSFTGGSNQINLTKQEIFEALGGKKDPVTGQYTTIGAYQLLENYMVDYIVPLGVCADDKLPNPNDNFAYQLAMGCAVISHRSRVCHGIIPTTSPEDSGLETVYGHVKHLVSDLPQEWYMKDAAGNVIYDGEGKPYDLGRFVSILAGPDVRFKHMVLGNYFTNSPALYAGMISALPVSSSPLNKKVPGADSLRFDYGNSQRNTLTEYRFVTYKLKDNGKTIAVEDAMTAAQSGSDYAALPNLRAVKKAVDNVREACDPFLGESPSVTNQNAMTSAIDKRLSQMKEPSNNANPDISGYDFKLTCSPFDRVLGNATIELTIQPPNTLRRITTIVSVAPSV